MNPDFDIGKFFKERIGNYSETPPEDIWEKIATCIPAAPAKTRSGPGSSVKFYYFAAGLFVAGLAALLIYLFSPETQIVHNRAVYEATHSPVANIQSPATEKLPTEPANTQVVPAGKTAIPSVPASSKGTHSVPTTATGTERLVHIASATPVMQPDSPNTLAVQSLPVDNPSRQNSSPVKDNLISSLSETDTMGGTEEVSEEVIESSLVVEQVITACRGEELTLNAGEGTGHRWSTGQSGQTINFTANDDIRLTVDYKDLQGRKVTGIFNISLLNCSVFVPRAFSPNDDGHNDLYRVKAEGISNFEMKIFSKWGEMVFHSRDPEAGWDGKQKGMPAPAGIYIYQINYTDPNNQTRAIFGTLTLLR